MTYISLYSIHEVTELYASLYQSMIAQKYFMIRCSYDLNDLIGCSLGLYPSVYFGAVGKTNKDKQKGNANGSITSLPNNRLSIAAR